ncbi:MAG: hypothetical protein V4547_17890 [Bacteroidota bacterium]
MFSPETKKAAVKALGTFVIVMIALAVHQKFVSPMLVKKPKTAVPPTIKL